MALIAIVVAAMAIFVPASFNWISTSWITPFLGLVMFGMGLTLDPHDFKVVFTRPKDIIIGSLAQFIIMPLAAFLFQLTGHRPLRHVSDGHRPRCHLLRMSDLPSACMIHEHSSPVFGALYDRSLTINYSQMIQLMKNSWLIHGHSCLKQFHMKNKVVKSCSMLSLLYALSLFL